MTAQHGGEGDILPPLRKVLLPLPKYRDSGGWRDRANCRLEGNAVFFIDIRQGTPPETIRIHTENAIKICVDCEVRLQCLNFAIRNEEHYGVWGGVNFRRIKKSIRKSLNEVNNL